MRIFQSNKSIFLTIALNIGFILSFSVSAQAVFDQQRTLYSATQLDGEYRFTLGVLKKVNGENRAEREVLLSGHVERRTVEFDRNMPVSEAWKMLRSRYLDGDYRELFSCEGLRCGSSNAWANDRFGVKQLYGLDQSQKYFALVNRANPSEFVALYFVQRGNRRIYAQVDTISVSGDAPSIPVSASTINSAFERDGRFVLPLRGLNASFPDEALNAIATALKSRPFTQLTLVGHAYSGASAEANEALGETYALTLKSALESRGIRNSRLEIKSVGDLAPGTSGMVDRVELLVRTAQ